MIIGKEELKDSQESCLCGNQAKIRYTWANGVTHERLLCGACQSTLELALSTKGMCSEFDTCEKCKH
jgi:hypothetical protein